MRVDSTGPRSQRSKGRFQSRDQLHNIRPGGSSSGSRNPGASRAGSWRSSLVFLGPAGSEVSEGARGPEVTEQREPRIRRCSGQGLREGTGRAAPAGPFGTRVRVGRGRAGHCAPLPGRAGWGGSGRLGMAQAWGRDRAGVRSPAGARRAAHGGGAGRGAQTGGAVPPAVCMLKYSVKPVCGAAVWGTSGW